MTGKGRHNAGSSVDACLSYWNDREIQLVRLHEEIVQRRESLLNCSMTYHQSQDTRTRYEASTGEKAYLRNHKLLKDIRSAQSDVFNALSSSATPRFMTLQKNYWAMVKSQLPMWEKDVGISRSKDTPMEAASVRQHPTQRQPTSPDQTKEKVKGITPRSKRGKKSSQKQATGSRN